MDREILAGELNGDVEGRIAGEEPLALSGDIGGRHGRRLVKLGQGLVGCVVEGRSGGEQGHT